MGNAGKIMIVVAAALSLASCANGQEPSPYPAGDGPTYPAPNPVAVASSAAPSSAPARVCTVDDVTVTGDFGSKPTVAIADTCTAPATLLTKDLKAGTGAVAKAGSTLQLNYDLVTFSDKVDRLNTFSGQPFSFTLGENQVIPGWDQALTGISQGGRRLVVVPPNLGYGATAQGGIKPNETLVYVFDAVQVTG